MYLSRRNFIKSVAGLTAFVSGSALGAGAVFRVPGEDGYCSAPLIAEAPAQGAADFWRMPRTLHLLRQETGEQISATYWKDGRLLPEGYYAASWLLRDVRAGKGVQMSPRLLDILFGVQGYLAHLHTRGFWLEITSGFRTPATNRMLREIGVPAARQSLHLYGKAGDLKVRGVSADVLGQIARYFQGGGVGVYRDGHIHVDDGRVRKWTA